MMIIIILMGLSFLTGAISIYYVLHKYKLIKYNAKNVNRFFDKQHLKVEKMRKNFL